MSNTCGADAPKTTLGEIARSLFAEPAAGFSAWARTTAGAVALLFALQFATGLLLAFVYVPSTESAHATVAYAEKVLGAGAWLRSLHGAVAQLLPLALALHLLQQFARGAHRRRPYGWLASVALLALTLAAGATGYTLPWDARALSSTHVAEGLARGFPLVGPAARRWLLGGEELSTLTLSRFYALHAFVTPFAIICVVGARLFVLRDFASAHGSAQARTTDDAQARVYRRAQLARQATTAGIVFFALALYAANSHAPLGPAADATPPGYLPRPGAQFLWLFQLLKHLPAPAASLVALALPALFLIGFALLPFLRLRAPGGATRLDVYAGATLFVLLFFVVAGLTAVARYEDARDPRTREQLAHQAQDEENFRRAPFKPRLIGAARLGASDGRDAAPTQLDAGPAVNSNIADPPVAYTRNCARCHGARGEGRSINPSLLGVSARPQRTAADIFAILNDPASYGLERRMPSFAKKLSDEEKRQIANWVVSLPAPQGR